MKKKVSPVTATQSLQEEIVEGHGASAFEAGRLDGPDPSTAAIGMVVALYLGLEERSVALAKQVVLHGDTTFHFVNPVRDAAIILSLRAAPDGALGRAIRSTVFPNGAPRSPFAAKARHVYEALLESLESGLASPRLVPAVVRPEINDGFLARWAAATTLRDRVALAGSYGRRVESVGLLDELLSHIGPFDGLSYPLIESILVLAARTGDARVPQVLKRFFPLWAPGASTDAAPLAPVLDGPMTQLISLSDRRALLETPRGGRGPLPVSQNLT